MELLNTAEAARFLRVSQASIRRWSDSGLLAAQRVGRRRERRFRESDLLAFLGRTPAGARGPDVVNVGGESVGVPGHLAALYSTDAGGLRLTVPFIAEGLRSGQPCYLAATGKELKRYTDALGARQDIDLARATESGQFKAVRFAGRKAAEAIAHWEREFAETLARGRTIIRIVGEMTSERTMFSSEEEMLDYEEACELMCRRYPVVVICQYDVREFDGEAVLRALKAHPDLFALGVGTFLN
jgi:excisionase family DNA binding protein